MDFPSVQAPEMGASEEPYFFPGRIRTGPAGTMTRTLHKPGEPEGWYSGISPGLFPGTNRTREIRTGYPPEYFSCFRRLFWQHPMSGITCAESGCPDLKMLPFEHVAFREGEGNGALSGADCIGHHEAGAVGSCAFRIRQHKF